VFNELIDALLQKKLFGNEQAELLRALKLENEKQLAEMITHNQDTKITLLLLDMCAFSGYVSQPVRSEAILQSVVGLLTNPDPRIRLNAALTIGRFQAHNQLPLLEKVALTDEKEYVRIMAIYAIAMWYLPQSAPVLISIADDRTLSIELREEAVEALGNTGANVVFMPLVRHLQDEHPRIRYTAIIALNNLRDPAAIPYLESLLSDTAQIHPPETMAQAAASTIRCLQRVANASAARDTPVQTPP
jgi:hypothetical protein